MQFFKLILVLCVAIGLMTNLTSAQDTDTIRINTNLISVGVVVKDKKGNYVKGLTKNQFNIFDDKTKQKIEFFSNEGAPVSFGIVYDLHPTTSERTRIILNSLKIFTDELPDKDDFFTIVFNERGSLNLNFVPTAQQVRRHLSFEERNKPNSLYDAVFLASEKIRKRPNQKKTLIIISDGKDHYSHHSFSQLSKQLKSFNVQIYAVILDEAEKWEYSDLMLNDSPPRIRINDSKLESGAMKDLSRKSGGKPETPFAKSSHELLEMYKVIASEMRHQYSIGFYPDKIDNKSHKLKVTVKSAEGNKKLDLFYRKKYRSLAKKQ